MRNEVGEVIRLGVNLHYLALVGVVLFFLLFMGYQISNDASLAASDMLGEAKVGLLEDMREEEHVIPTAALYNIVRTYDAFIPEYVCKCSVHAGHHVGPYDLSAGMTPCVLLHMTGRVSVEVGLAATTGYSVTVHDPGCTWFSGVCTCP